MLGKKAYKSEDKLRIVMEGMNGTISVADLCRKYDIGTARFYYWNDQLVNSAREIFENRGRKRDENQITAEKDLEISKLKDVISEEVKDIKSMFYDIHRTVTNAVERSGYSITQVLGILVIPRSWYYSRMDFSPLLGGRFITFSTGYK